MYCVADSGSPARRARMTYSTIDAVDVEQVGARELERGRLAGPWGRAAQYSMVEYCTIIGEAKRIVF